MTRGLAWVDYDNDGWIDLSIGNTLGGTRLFQNNRDGSFTDVSLAVGYDSDSTRHAWGTVWADYDNDGDLDWYIVYGGFGPPIENQLWRNDVNVNGKFTNITDSMGDTGGAGDTFGAAWGDFDNDGNIDLIISNLNSPLVLLRNRGDGTFQDVTVSAGIVAQDDSRMAPIWIDYDLNGFPDIFIPVLNNPNLLFHNNGNGTFTEVAAQAGVGLSRSPSFVSSSADFNNDETNRKG